MKNVATGINIALTATLLATILLSNRQPEGSSSATRELPQVIRSVNLNRSFGLAGEALPADNDDALDRLERELTINTYGHANTLMAIKYSSRYFPTMERILREERVPDDFKYLAVAESNLRNVTSPAKARGMWQFVPETAISLGLEVNGEVDERNHLEKSTRAAAIYLRRYKERFGSWTLAAAAYNMGGTALNSDIQKQFTSNYYDLNLNDETNRYVFRIIAFKEIISRPLDFGYQLDPADYYPPLDNYRIVTVREPIPSLGEFARRYGISYRSLKLYNPWLMSNKLTNPNRIAYEIKIPYQ
jgi:hypothetical protein